MCSPKDDKLVAPTIDSLLRYFDRGIVNPVQATSELLAAVEPLFQAVSSLAPIDQDDEVKTLWLKIPRGAIEDYDTFESMKAWGDVETYEEYEECWLEEYPEEYSWYRFVAVQSFESDGRLRYVGISLGNKTLVSASTDERFAGVRGVCHVEEAACRICSLVLPAVQDSVELLNAGTYNFLVAAELPYQFRVGVIKRRDLWEAAPDAKAYDYDGLSEKAVRAFKELVEMGANCADRVKRMREFTANDFFHACKLGYESIGKDCEGVAPSELYCRYADGRDEGLTGRGCGLSAGPGIDFDDPKAWDEWYFHRSKQGGHPWEVVRGGNSTHVDLYVSHDRHELRWKLELGKITEEEYERRMDGAGYYFVIAGKHRQFEAVSFYLALQSAGLPVVIRDAEQLLARFEGTDWIGVVPHHVIPRYCEELFPEEYGSIIDFTHVFQGEDAWFDSITWIPQEEAKLIECM